MPLPPGLRIEPVIDAAGLAAFAEPFGRAFGDGSQAWLAKMTSAMMARTATMD